MGRRLFETEPVFRRCLEECDDLLKARSGLPLLDSLFAGIEGNNGAPSYDRTDWAQPAVFALQYGLAQTWRAWGVSPEAVMGHSVGELAAACVAGVFSLEDALEFVADRGRLMQSLPGDGAMIAIEAPEHRIREAIGFDGGEVEVAAVNATGRVVLSGPTAAIRSAERQLESRGIGVNRLRVAHAFHSAAMDSILADLRVAAGRIRFAKPRITLVSTLTGRPAGTEVSTAEYWVDHARRTVRFADAMRSLGEAGPTCYVEIGPRPILVGLGRECLAGGSDLWLASLSPPADDRTTMMESLGALYEAGLDIDWPALHRGRERRRVALPTYPFRREPYWIAVPDEAAGLPVGPAADGKWQAARSTG